MSKYYIIILIVLAIPINALTREEAIAYIDNPDNREQLIADIIRLDDIETATPIFPDPRYTAVLLESGDLVVYPINPITYLKIGYLEYEVYYDSKTIADFYKPPKSKHWRYFFCGFFAGFLTGWLVPTPY